MERISKRRHAVAKDDCIGGTVITSITIMLYKNRAQGNYRGFEQSNFSPTEDSLTRNEPGLVVVSY